MTSRCKLISMKFGILEISGHFSSWNSVPTCDQNQWYLVCRYLVRDVTCWFVARKYALWLSSYTVECSLICLRLLQHSAWRDISSASSYVEVMQNHSPHDRASRIFHRLLPRTHCWQVLLARHARRMMGHHAPTDKIAPQSLLPMMPCRQQLISLRDSYYTT